MHYKIEPISKTRQLLGITLNIKGLETEKLIAQMPAWRPGRYQLQQYAANVLKFEARCESNGKYLDCQKITKDKWSIGTKGVSNVTIYYEYYARNMDAGGSWVDETQVYLNFINFALHIEGYSHTPHTVSVELPPDYTVATALTKDTDGFFRAHDYLELVDSPLIASKDLQKLSYQSYGKNFFIWLNGDTGSLNIRQLKEDFLRFTDTQISLFEGFPCDSYHFLIQLLPYRHYHGVEHAESTVITLGPVGILHKRSHYLNLLGIASHELFHTWNVTRIRPKPLLPYNFSTEQYFDSGFIAEGFTTYLGDLMLAKSGAISNKEYLDEINGLLDRHFKNEGQYSRSLTEASVDLWMDGYSKQEVPRTVSIYVKGGLVALMLDLYLIHNTKRQYDLMYVMKALWHNFAEQGSGYTIEDCQKSLEKLTGIDFSSFFTDYVFGILPLEKELAILLSHFGYDLREEPHQDYLASYYGIEVEKGGFPSKVSAVAVNSIAAEKIRVGDEIVAINGQKYSKIQKEANENTDELNLTFFRNDEIRVTRIKRSGQKYYNSYRIVTSEKLTNGQIVNRRRWLT